MPFIPVPNTVQAELVYNWNGEICENVFHFEAAGAPIVSEMVELGEYLINWYDVHLQPLHTGNISLINVKLTDLNAAFAPAVDVSTGLPLVGTLPGDSLPNNVAACISKRTIFRGRSYRGRIYHPCLGEAQVTGNTILTATRTSLLAAYSLLIGFSTAGEAWQMVVVSRFEGGAPRATGLTTPVTNLSMETTVDSQRRRLPGRGT